MQWASYLFKLYALSQFSFLTQLHGSLSFHVYKNRFKVTHHVVIFVGVKSTSVSKLINTAMWYRNLQQKQIFWWHKFITDTKHGIFPIKIFASRKDQHWFCARGRRNIESRKSTWSNEFRNRAEEKLLRKVTRVYRPKGRKGKTHPL